MTTNFKRASLWACAAAGLALAACGGGTTNGTTGGTGGSSGTTGTTGTTTGGGTTGTTTGGGTTTTGGGKTYCDGFAADTDAGAQVYVQTYAFGKSLTSCGSLVLDASKVTDGMTFATIGGVFDIDSSDNGTGASAPGDPAIFPTACDDMGVGTFTAAGDGGMDFTAPTGSSTIAAAVAAGASTTSIYGVVTGVYGWSCTAPATGCSGTKAASGTLYLQDAVAAGGTPAANSGISLYMKEGGKASVNINYGTVPARGDVVEVTNLSFGAYKGQTQFTATTSTQVTKIGTAPLPPPVAVNASDVGPSSTTATYRGMRVTVNGGPFTVAGSGGSSTCPAPLTYTSASGG
ncbi:MAG: hypothetical protein ACYCWW_13415 [Deltaproteobacteria bacterium]